MTKPSGIDLIAAERLRQQTVEGWTEEHDDGHGKGEMALAAVCYALPHVTRGRETLLAREVSLFDKIWPFQWDRHWWKPSPDDRIRELVKAGALIAAEIDRLQRLESSNDQA